MSNTAKYLVGVTQRIDKIAAYGEVRDALDQRLVGWLAEAGCLPVPIPNSLSESALGSWLDCVGPSALVLSGGNDVGQYSTRDRTEQLLLDWATKRRMPVLGICRGLQMMAVWAGASLVKTDGHVRTRHQLVIANEKGKWPESVNSYHDWRLASCPAGFEVAATSEDGSIEAVRHMQLPWEGWMWHPERESTHSPQDQERLVRLFAIQGETR
jgi:gamma-glutamyl-gamma-aminobutyrate hydrolase PuuD